MGARACLSDDEVVAFGHGDVETRARDEIEAHLDGCAACRRLVAALATEETRGHTPRPVAEVIDGQYRIGRMLGRGGMGVVYLARDLRLDRDVAVKIGTAVSGSALQRVEREAIALARLSHPNVVVVHQVGELGGRLYLAMEWVAGGNAREWLAQRTRTWREIVALYVAAGEGLAAAHAAGLVHRDFKPDNVLVGLDGRPRVADFGLVRSGGSASSDPIPADASPVMDRMTQTGVVLGTPAYMAPEQAAGGDVDERTDQFSFCVALWEALYGARPFAGRTPAELAESMEAPLRPPIDRERARAVPRHVADALRRGLARDPAARWPSMNALLAVLRADPRARRRRVAIAIAIGTAGIGIAAGVALATYLRGDHGSAPAAAPVAAAAPPCAPRDPGARDLYVGASARDGGTGTAACPFRTITQALDARRDRPATIHVAAGSYDAAHGEHFPLVLRGEIDLEGAGADTTHVIGTGTWDPRGTAAGDDEQHVTVVVGDDRATTRIGGMSFAPGAISADLGTVGVQCDRGSLGELDHAADAGPPSTVLHDVEVASYTIGVIATDTSRGTGCALRLERGFVHHDHWGVWGLGCGLVSQPPPQITAGVDVADSRFVEMRDAHGGDGIGIAIWDCTRWFTLRGSTVGSNDVGVAAVNHWTPTTHIVIEHDNFVDNLQTGVAIGRAARIDRLVGNTFEGNSGGPARMIADRGFGLVLDGSNEPHASPGVLFARNNSFMENDVAIELRGGVGFGGPIDFGRADDPGHNELRCNRTIDGSAVPGHDVVVSGRVAPHAQLWFAGDVWDHAPPTTGATPNGADVEAPPRALDLAAAIGARNACSSRGP